MSGAIISAGITEDQAVKCILGEARGEYKKHGFKSFLYLAEALRNRGTTSGVYGCNALISKREAAFIKSLGLDREAARAWRASALSNETQGASYWGSLIVDRAWIKTMQKAGYVQTATIGNHVYYKRGF